MSYPINGIKQDQESFDHAALALTTNFNPIRDEMLARLKSFSDAAKDNNVRAGLGERKIHPNGCWEYSLSANGDEYVIIVTNAVHLVQDVLGNQLATKMFVYFNRGDALPFMEVVFYTQRKGYALVLNEYGYREGQRDGKTLLAFEDIPTGTGIAIADNMIQTIYSIDLFWNETPTLDSLRTGRTANNRSIGFKAK